MPKAYFQTEIKCPLCEHVFSIIKIRSSSCRPQVRHSDFHITYEGKNNPLVYGVFVCPQCHYAALDKNFATAINNEFKETLRMTLTLSFENEHKLDGERDLHDSLYGHKLAVLCAELTHKGPGVLAGLYLRCAWVCRELEKNEEEIQFLEKAKDLYLMSYAKERSLPGKLTEVKLLYLIGELHRRLGLFNEAVKWFDRAMRNPKLKLEPEVNNLIHKQWQLAREQYKKQKNNDALDKNPDKEKNKKTNKKTMVQVSLDDDIRKWLISLISNETVRANDDLSLLVQQVLMGLHDAGVIIHSESITLVREEIKKAVSGPQHL